jgi:UDP-hydrolysing UDP-N-acetyl-D-glucosamine 2-epimerase
VITGTRAEYGLLRTVMRAIARQPGLQLQVVAAGMHLLRRFGGTAREIERDGWRIAARVPMQAGSDAVLDQARGLARGVAGIARVLEAGRTDIVVVLGDRIEALAGALAAVTTHRVLAHIHGGDVAPGDLDDGLRHAITKLAHVHFAATRRSARRIQRLGERPEHVHVVGAPGLDELAELLARRGRDERPPRRGQALVVQHACGRPAAHEAGVMTTILAAVAAAGLRRRIVYPNTDRGHSGILRAIARHRRGSAPGDVQVFRSLPRDRFLRVLLEADVLVGNSSCGIIEAPLAGTPAVDVGPRQAGREPGGRGVIHASESGPALRAALACALRRGPRRVRRTPYGDGQAGRRIARLLARLPLTPALRKKLIQY